MGCCRPGRRGRRYDHQEQRFQSLRQSLWELDGFKVGSQPVDGEGPLRAGCVQHLRERVACFGSPPPDLTTSDGTSGDAEIFRELLGSHADYAGEAQTFASLRLEALALPSEGRPPVPVFDNPEIVDSPSADDFVSRYLLPTSAARERMAAAGFGRPYLDPSLRGSAKRYAAFVQRLVASQVVELTLEPGECVVGAFAVKKKS